MTNEKPKQLTPNETTRLVGSIRDVLATDRGALVVMGRIDEEGRTFRFAKGQGMDIITLLAIGAVEFAEHANVPVEEMADIIRNAILVTAEEIGRTPGRAS